MKREAGADDGIRTRDLRFTKPLLYQLSYVGGSGKTLHSRARDTSALEAASLCEALDSGRKAPAHCAHHARHASHRDAATMATQMSRRFHAMRCAPEFSAVRLRSAQSARGMVRSSTGTFDDGPER